MKTSATITTLEPPGTSNRRQPLRQTRTNPARTATRPFNGRGALDGPAQDGTNPNAARGFYPAITHFTDSITALPKEMIRHYTMLKEVDAKIYGPEETVRQLAAAALQSPVPRRPNPQPHSNHDQSSQGTAVDNATGQTINGTLNGPNSRPDTTTFTNPPPELTAAELNRKQLFFNLRNTMKDMLNTLDEKNHVMSTATDALERQLARCETSYPHIENEISEEARYGNLNHWAYMERPAEKKGTTAGERTRREAANASAATAVATQAHDGEPATNRSEARREAVAARKSRNHQVDSDFDDARPAGHGSAKKTAGPGKGRKAAEPAQSNAAPITALGISNGPNGGVGSSAPKRRKIEKPVPTSNMGGATIERSMSGVYGPTAGTSRGGAGSPSATPLLDSTKRKPRGGGMTNGGGRRRAGTNASAANSPSLVSSPVVGSFAAAAKGAASPLPLVMQRTQSARGRQNSTQSVTQANRPPSSASNKHINGTIVHAAQMDIDKFPGANSKNNTDSKNSARDTVAKGSPRVETLNSGDMDGAADVNMAKRTSDKAPKREEAEATTIPRTRTERPPSISTSTRNAGKISKTATPMSATFPEPSRPRSNRNNHKDEPVIKRSHKKGAGLLAAQLAALQAAKEHREDGESQSSVQEEEEEAEAEGEGEGEPLYCYCNQVSYGEMVACDYEGCKKEWFHLDCAGLAKSPPKSMKWYCKDCKEVMKKSGSQPSSR